MNAFPDFNSSEMELSTIDLCLIEFDTLYQSGQKPKSADFEMRFQDHDRADFVELIYYEFCRLEADGLEPDRFQFITDHHRYKNELEKLFLIHFGLGLTTFQIDDHETHAKTDFAKMPGIGDAIGPFRLIKTLGQGGMGRVFLAIQTDLGDRKVVLKITVAGPSDESELMARVVHPNVMSVYRHFRTDDRFFDVIVMPYIPGASLDQLLLRSHPAGSGPEKPPNRMSPIRAVDVRPELNRIAKETDAQSGADLNPTRDFPGLDVAVSPWPEQVRIWAETLSEALFTTYRQGVIHGDIKPGNIYIGVDKSPYLLDFHLARKWRFEKYRRVTDPNDPGGTLYYMPPERLLRFAGTGMETAKNQVSKKVRELHRGDLYSLGLVILELLTGYDPARATPFPESDPATQARWIAKNRQHPQWLNDWPGFRRLPKPWRVILSKMLASEITDRFEDGKTLADALRAMNPQSHFISSPLQIRGRLTPRLVLFAACCIVMVSVAWFIQSSRQNYRNSVQMLWNLPDHLGVDPSMSIEQPLSQRIKLARLQLMQARHEHPDFWNRSRVRNIVQPKGSRLDSEIWLMGRMESLVEALMKRGSVSKNRVDMQSAFKMTQEGMERWNSSSWKALSAQIHAITKNDPNREMIGTAGEIRKFDANHEILQSYCEASSDQGGSQSGALRLWLHLIDQSPDSFGVRWGFVRYLVNYDRKQKAIDQLEQIKRIAPEHFESRRLLAFLMYQTGAFQTALEEVEMANQLRADDLSALRLRAILRVVNGQKQELIAEVARMGELIDEDQKGSSFLGQTRMEAERLVGKENLDSKAERPHEIFDLKTLQAIAAIVPDDPVVLYPLMYQYFKEDQTDDAIQIMERIATLKPESIQVQINLSILYKLNGLLEKSVKASMIALSRPDFPGWLKYQDSLVNHFINLCESVKRTELEQAFAICEKLAFNCEAAGLGKGECYYEMARLVIAKSGHSGLNEALRNLIRSGQQNQGYLLKWYPQDTVFEPYRARLDQELKKVFPEMEFKNQPEK